MRILCQARIPMLLSRAGAGGTAASLRRHRAFTIIEVMLAIGIFSMILLSIYSVWTGILKASRAGIAAGAEAQRARISMRSVEDALLTAQMFTANMPPQTPDAYYSFLADNSGDYSWLSFVARLPASFPGVGRYGDNIVRRVTFTVEPGEDRTPNLIMRQAPMLMAMDEEFEPYSLVLAKDVQFFLVEFWGPREANSREMDWVTEWKSTNALPRLVRVGLGLGATGKKGDAHNVAVKVISLPSNAVLPEWQMPPGALGGPRPPGAVPPGGVPPGGVPPGGVPPRIPPGPGGGVFRSGGR